MSTPTSLELPEGTRRATVATARGEFTVLDALPAAGPCELGTALLVPGYTGSKEDFIAILGQLAAAGRRVVAVDQRGQYQTAGPDDPDAYHPRELGADITALFEATKGTHLLGHSFGGLAVREAVLGGCSPASLTLLSSGPAALSGSRAEELHFMLRYWTAPRLRPCGPRSPRSGTACSSRRRWRRVSGTTVMAFLEERMLANNPTGLVTMATHLLKAEDKTTELAARGVPAFVLYGEEDNAWRPRSSATWPSGSARSAPAFPVRATTRTSRAPASTALALTKFWKRRRVLARRLPDGGRSRCCSRGRPTQRRS